MRRTILLALLLISGCASEVVRAPTDFVGVSGTQARRIVTVQSAEIVLDSGYRRIINSGVVLIETGSIDAGRVYKPTNTVFTIEGKHMHEAYFVLRNERLVGFYLPVEHAFSPLSQSIVLSIKEGGQ